LQKSSSASSQKPFSAISGQQPLSIEKKRLHKGSHFVCKIAVILTAISVKVRLIAS